MGTGPRALVFIGVIPPPVDGKAVATSAILNRLQKGFDNVHAITTSFNTGSRWRRVLAKVRWTSRAFVKVIQLNIRGLQPGVYLVADGGPGIYLTAFQCLLLTPFAVQVHVHHHGLRWMIHYDRILALTLFGGKTVHITQCPTMSCYLKKTYEHIATRSLSNAFLVEPTPADIPMGAVNRPDTFFRLAHLSNLSLHKGLDTVCLTYERLTTAGTPVTLRLGGVPSDPHAHSWYSYIQTQYRDVEAVGFVDQDSKAAFFTGVHVFLFPTVYPLETEGIVTLEALARGIPVIAYNQCCLAENLTEPGAFALPRTADFVSAAAELVLFWQQNPDEYTRARTHARQRYLELHQKSQGDLKHLMEELAGTP